MTARIIMKLLIEDIQDEPGAVRVLTLKHPKRPVLPAWQPGAHVDLRLPDGRIRQYSLISDPEDLTRYRIAVKCEENGRGGSKWVHESLDIGSEAHISAPRCNFSLDGSGAYHFFIAGGIGITPLMAMARQALASGASFDLAYCTSLEVPPFAAELHAWFGGRLRIFSAGGAAKRRFDVRAGLPKQEPGVRIYCCGPERLTGAVREATRDWPEGQVHFEVFKPALDENFKPEPFDIKIASTGQILRVPAEKSALSVLKDAGFLLPSSCELGVCGSCLCGYREGVAIHRDSVLPVHARQDRIMLCVSRARVQITLDL